MTKNSPTAADLLAARKKLLGLSYAELAARSGLPRSTIRRAISSPSGTAAATLGRVMVALALSDADMLRVLAVL